MGKTRSSICLIGLTVLVATVSGCTARYSACGVDEWVAHKRVREATLDGTARIHLVDGSRHEATLVAAGRDSLYWEDAITGIPRSAVLADVCTVTLTNHGRGAAQGFGIGLLSGAVIGAATGYASGDDSGGFLAFSAEEKAAMGAFGLGLLGGALGAIAGGADGAHDVFEFAGAAAGTGDDLARLGPEFMVDDDRP